MGFRRCGRALFGALTVVLVSLPAAVSAQTVPAVGAADIGGTVKGPAGPEAGVWVIAETTDLPTTFRQDGGDRRRRPLRHPRAARCKLQGLGARLWPDRFRQSRTRARRDAGADGETGGKPGGRGEILSGHVLVFDAQDSRGKRVSRVRPTAPPACRRASKTQADWIDTVKNSCQSCHALGSDNVRSPHKELGTFPNSIEMWARRLQSGQAMTNMAIAISRLGPERGYRMFADWTDRIAAGELPFDEAVASEGRRAQRRDHRVGLGHADDVSARCGLDRQAQPDRQRQRPGLRLARGKLGLRSGARSRAQHRAS